jgi:hypothetical protein
MNQAAQDAAIRFERAAWLAGMNDADPQREGGSIWTTVIGDSSDSLWH